jgi:dihydropteroate synthase
MKEIKAKYDKIKDWKMDPKGYFLIKIENKEIVVGYCKKHKKIESKIIGKSAIEIVNTIISNNMVSTIQHAADLGIELCKAEIALKNNLKYVQDKELKI